MEENSTFVIPVQTRPFSYSRFSDLDGRKITSLNSSSDTSYSVSYQMFLKTRNSKTTLFGILAFLTNLTGQSSCAAATRSFRYNDLPSVVDPNLAVYPSPDEDGTFYIVNLAEDSASKLGRHDQPGNTINFFLYTKHSDGLRENVHEIKIGEENPAWLPFFKSNATTRILCHGYKGSHLKPFPAQLLKTSLLGNSVNVNVVLIGWEALANSDMVQSAVRNMRYVGEKTAEMLSYVYRYSQINFKKIHFIGHNLGAHIGGITGESLQRSMKVQLGRITGLDPAGVKDCDDIENLLDATDAEFVDAIHTDSGNHCGAAWISDEDIFRHWGHGGQVGHVDYYPPEINETWKSELPEASRTCPHCRSYKILEDIILKNSANGNEDFSICNCDDSPASLCKCILP